MADTNSGVVDIEAKTDEHFKKCYTEFPYYAKSNLKIRTKAGELVQFELNEVQALMEDILTDIKRRGLMVRMYILKARQEGISTWSTGRFFWKVSNKKNRSAVVVTHEPDATRNLFNMQKRYYKHLEPEFKPKHKYNNVKVLQFDTDDGTGLDSSIGVATAGVKDFGSSQTIHHLHLSELSKWPRENEEDLLTSLFQCVPDEPGTDIIIESTAKGIGGEFYKGYWASRYHYEFYLEDGVAKWRFKVNRDADEANEYVSVFIPWFVFSRYRKAAPDDFQPTLEELLLKKRFGLDNDQLNWYRFILANKCKGKKDVRDQEYPMTAKSAFIGSGSPAFSVEKVMEAMERAPEPLVRYNFFHIKKKLVEDVEGEIEVWEEPRHMTPYVISADVAEGLEHGDFNSATVWNHMTGEQAAHYHGHISPFKFAYLLDFLGRRYNDAWLVPERNNHGISVVEKLCNIKEDGGLDYPNVYMEMVPDPPGKPRRRFGWVTSGKSRVLILDLLIDEVFEGTSGIKCKEIFEEMLNFKTQKDGKIEADPGTFDDRVMDCAIGRYTLKTLPYILGESEYKPKFTDSGYNHLNALVQAQPSVSAWN